MAAITLAIAFSYRPPALLAPSVESCAEAQALHLRACLFSIEMEELCWTTVPSWVMQVSLVRRNLAPLAGLPLRFATQSIAGSLHSERGVVEVVSMAVVPLETFVALVRRFLPPSVSHSSYPLPPHRLSSSLPPST